MRILLISRFNVSNIGDLTISNKLLEVIKEYGEVTKYNLFGAPYKFTDINNVDTSNFTFKYKIINTFNHLGLKKVISLYSKAKKYLINRKNNFSKDFSELVNQHDLLIIGGGNMLMSITNSIEGIKNFNNYVSIAKKNKKPVFIVDIGIGPFKELNHQEYAIKTLNKCDRITFRDHESYSLFINNGGNKDKAFVSVDPAFLYTYPKTTKKNTTSRIIGINILDTHFLGKSSQEYKKSILTYENLVRKVLSTNDKVILFVSSKEDEKAMLEVYKKFRNNPNVKVYDVNGLSDIRKLYNKIDLLIGTRMHSMIIAYTMYVPLVALSWQTKIDSMFTMIEEQENLFKLDNLERDLNKIKSTYLYQLDNLQLYERKRRKVLEKIKRKSRINNKILLEFKNNIG